MNPIKSSQSTAIPLHLIILCTIPEGSIVRTVRYLSSQGDSEAVRYTVHCASRSRNDYCEFRGSGRSCSRSAAGISACSRPARQCPDRPVTPRSNPGMHAVSENSEFRIPKCPDCIHAKSVRIPVLLILLYTDLLSVGAVVKIRCGHARAYVYAIYGVTPRARTTAYVYIRIRTGSLRA